MSVGEELLFTAVWFAWGIYWLTQAVNVKRAAKSESWLARLSHIVPLAIAVLLLWLPWFPIAPLDTRLAPGAQWPVYLGFVLTGAGLAFSVWARRHIGRNWSLTVTLKQDHELITSGPYAYVRHPIYSGLLLAIAGYALARGELRGLLAFALVYCSLRRKMRIEERWMEERFGAAYAEYRRNAAALLPHFHLRRRPRA